MGDLKIVPPNKKKNNAFLSLIWAAPQIKRGRGFRTVRDFFAKVHFFCPGPWKGCLYLRNTKKARGQKKRDSPLALCFLFFFSLRFDSVQMSRSTYVPRYVRHVTWVQLASCKRSVISCYSLRERGSTFSPSLISLQEGGQLLLPPAPTMKRK